MQYSVEIGKNIVILRKARGLSQEQLAEKAGIGTTWMRAIEHDCANVTRDIIERLAEALEVSVWILYELQLEPDAVWTELHEIRALLGLGGEAVLA